MDSVPVGDIRRFEAELLADLHHSAAGVTRTSPVAALCPTTTLPH